MCCQGHKEAVWQQRASSMCAADEGKRPTTRAHMPCQLSMHPSPQSSGRRL